MISGIKPKAEIEKKRKIKTTILSIIMLMILILSTIGYAFFTADRTPKQNTKEPNQDQNSKNPVGKISFEYQGIQLDLLSSVEEISNIPIIINSTPVDYTGKVLYLDIKNDGILKEISTNLGKFTSRIQRACYGKCGENLPEKTCKDSIIVWNQSTENKVYQKEKCIFIEGDVTAADAFIYKLFKQ